jgi:hypothetical protein
MRVGKASLRDAAYRMNNRDEVDKYAREKGLATALLLLLR